MNMPKDIRLLATIFIIVLAEVLMIVFLAQEVKKRVDSSLVITEIEKEQNLARQVATNLSDDLTTVQNKLSLISQRPGIMEGTTKECVEEMEKAFPYLGEKVDNLVKVNLKGVVTCSVNKAAIGIDISGNPDIKRMLEDPDHNPAAIRVILSSITKLHASAIYIPVKDARGKFVGFLGGSIYFEKMGEKYFKEAPQAKKGSLSLIDDNGDILYGAKTEYIGKNLLSEEILKLVPENIKQDYTKLVTGVLEDAKNGKPATLRTELIPGRESLSAYYPVTVVPGRYWLVSASIPVSEITNQLDVDSLIPGYNNFAVMLVGVIALVLITELGLFYYLLAHLRTHQQPKKEAAGD
jgi:hypothetical protein